MEFIRILDDGTDTIGAYLSLSPEGFFAVELLVESMDLFEPHRYWLTFDGARAEEHAELMLEELTYDKALSFINHMDLHNNDEHMVHYEH